MHSEFQAYLNVFRFIARYAVDRDARNFQDNKSEKFFNLSSEQFVKEFYVANEDTEAKVKDLIINSQDINFLIGPRGSGKTSISIKSIYDCKNDFPKNYLFIYIDLRKHTENEWFATKDSFVKYLKDFIINFYLDNYFEIRASGENKRLLLYNYLLEDPKEDFFRPDALFFELRQVKDSLLKLYRHYLKCSQKTNQDYPIINWLTDYHDVEKDIINLTEILDPLLEIKHLVHAVRQIYNFDKQVIFFDNVDRLNEVIQSDLVDYMKNSLLNYSGIVTYMCSIREENILKDYELIEDEAPPYFSKVYITKSTKKYQAYELRITKNGQISKVVDKRIEFARNHQFKVKEIIERENNKLELKKRKIEVEKPYNFQSDANWDFYRRELNLNNELIKTYFPVLSDNNFKLLKEIFSSMMSVCAKENAIYISNNSMRGFLYGHYHFIKFLLEIQPNEFLSLPYKDYPAVLEYIKRHSDWILSTLFFIFLRRTNKEQNLGFYDIIELIKTDSNNTSCIIPHLIITTIWNLTLEKENLKEKLYRNPSVAEVIESMGKLGYDRKIILIYLFKLYSEDNIRGNLVEFRVRHSIKDMSEIKDDFLIYITHRGRCFASNTSLSLGYLYECIRVYEATSSNENISPDILPVEGYLAKVLPYMKEIAILHCQTLIKIFTSWQNLYPNKLEYYLKHYGIPQIYPFNISVPERQTTDKIKRELLIVTFFMRIKKIAMNDHYRNITDNFLNSFQKEVEAISDHDYSLTEYGNLRYLDSIII